jgi:hypothetical protein
MEITDQYISDFIKSRGKFTYTKAEPSPYFYFDPNKGDVWEYRIEIFGFDVWFQAQSHFHDQSILDEIRDNLIKRLISGGYAGAAFDAGGREKILKILRREKNLNYLLNGRD